MVMSGCAWWVVFTNRQLCVCTGDSSSCRSNPARRDFRGCPQSGSALQSSPLPQKAWGHQGSPLCWAGDPQLGKHHIPPLHTGRTGVGLAAPTPAGTVALHQLGRKHRTPTSWKNDSPKGPYVLLFSALHPCFPGDTRLVSGPWKSNGAVLRGLSYPGWAAASSHPRPGGFRLQFKAHTRPSSSSQVTLHKQPISAVLGTADPQHGQPVSAGMDDAGWTSWRAKGKLSHDFPEPSPALISFGQTSILTQFSSQSQTLSLQQVQPRQQSPSPPSALRSQPGTGVKQSIGSRKPHLPSPSPWCFFTPEESSPFARPCSY